VAVIGDLFPGFLSWGYVYGLLALGTMVAGVLAYDRARATGRRLWLPGAIGALTSLLHPWNGALLIMVLVGAELLAPRERSRGRPRFLLPGVTVIATALPLAYYGLLIETDASWQLARGAAKHSFSVWSLGLAMLPLVLPSLLAYRRRPRAFLDAATWTWPVAAFAVFVVSATAIGATPLHALQGITIPVVVLAIKGIQSIGWRRTRGSLAVGGVLVALFTVPATVYELKTAADLAAPTTNNANFITPGEQNALRYLAQSTVPGGVLTRNYLGALVPGETGRHTYIGDCMWSEPNCQQRYTSTETLFGGSLPASAARTLVVESGARLILADCKTTANLPKLLGSLLSSTRKFGCASVYTVA
jgi:hypothetical protein